MRASMAAEEVESMKQGIDMADATGRKVDAAKMSTTRAEKEESMGAKRGTERRMDSVRRKKGSVRVGTERVERGSGKSWRMDEGREDRRRDSAAETVGRAARRVMSMPRAERALARRAKGTRWPMPALGKSRIRGCLAPRLDAEGDMAAKKREF
ncbi:hypothetical protein HPP92_017997 [Vanilla planifolia]|uniref:Uncharacterized protein n=1 Tax=Vanilla planifolia TaxID=51239 RepID=A0A835ULV2_VANPL|nr:hypothetical protein HPP92_017997 [Vanilla planifolia]